MVVTDVVLPIFLIVFLGFLLRRLGGVDERVFSRAQLYILVPALIFSAMTGRDTGLPILLRVVLFVAALSVGLLLAAQAVGFAFRGGRLTRNAISLASMFSNSGFYGIPVCMLAFGEQGVLYAVIFITGSSLIQSTLGIFIASSGRKKAREAFLTVLKVPMVYSIIAAKILSHYSLLPPKPFMEMIDMLGQAAIPLGLLLLGMQLQKIIYERMEKRRSGTGEQLRKGRIEMLQGLAAAALKIAGGFLLALLLTRIFGFDSLIRKVLIVEASMPTAVNAVVFATEFDCKPEVVTVGILASTLASVVSITLILNFLG